MVIVGAMGSMLFFTPLSVILEESGILWKLTLCFPDLRVIVPVSNLIEALAVVKNGVPKIKGGVGHDVYVRTLIDEGAYSLKVPYATRCFRDDLRCRNGSDRLDEFFHFIPTLMVVKGEFLNDFQRSVGVLIAEFSSSGMVYLTLKVKGDMIIENLDLKLKIDAVMRDFLVQVLETSPCFGYRFSMILLEHQDIVAEFCCPSRWKELSKESGTSDEEIEGPMKDQPLSTDASPTTLSPGYIADSDPEEDKEDPEEDPADHPADG
ncbi:hypothetical protein Tco_1419224 [Tanacetum coccineum]